jgi:hypothetical protein
MDDNTLTADPVGVWGIGIQEEQEADDPTG